MEKPRNFKYWPEIGWYLTFSAKHGPYMQVHCSIQTCMLSEVAYTQVLV